MKYTIRKNKENPSELTLVGEEGAKEYYIVKSNYRVIMDWLKSNLEFKEARIEQMRNRMDVVSINKARVNGLKELVEEARVSASSKEGYYFNVLDAELQSGYTI